jgi:two-component system OmpR family sensor kinase
VSSVLDRLWSRVWLAVFLATAIPLVAFLLLGAVLLQASAEKSDIAALSRQANLLSAIIAKQSGEQRSTIQDAVASVGRTLTIFPADAVGSHLPAPAANELEQNGSASGRLGEPHSALFAAVRRGSEVVVLERPYTAPIIDWRPWTGRIVLGTLLAVACAVAASVAVARAVTRPVSRVAVASRQVGAGATPLPIETGGPRELRFLTDNFNDMSRELARIRAAERSFLLSVSHELKTPIAAIRGFALGQQEGVVSAGMAGQFIVSESVRLERLVEDLLDLARLGQGRFTVRSEPVDLAVLAGEAIRRCEAAASELKTHVELEASPESSAQGDPDRIVQVITNLVENALRLSPEGGTVRVRVGPGLVSVVDSGPGLAEDDLAHAFDRFRLYDRYKASRPVGTGLGLALVRELVEAMAGRVEARSGRDGGATFSVYLPHGAG